MSTGTKLLAIYKRQRDGGSKRWEWL